ncbi:MAG TPA: hypothetical protein VI912_00175 [Candidatus Bilamarchaeaceae archaeon]|nr:hypothetical protein [Candidatus Bilamarchaeaceae archaeon]
MKNAILFLVLLGLLFAGVAEEGDYTINNLEKKDGIKIGDKYFVVEDISLVNAQYGLGCKRSTSFDYKVYKKTTNFGIPSVSTLDSGTLNEGETYSLPVPKPSSGVFGDGAGEVVITVEDISSNPSDSFALGCGSYTPNVDLSVNVPAVNTCTDPDGADQDFLNAGSFNVRRYQSTSNSRYTYTLQSLGGATIYGFITYDIQTTEIASTTYSDSCATGLKVSEATCADGFDPDYETYGCDFYVGPDYTCQAGACVAPAEAPPECENDADCENPNLVCFNNQCGPAIGEPCENDAECSQGLTCSDDNVCVECSISKECANFEICFSGNCVEGEPLDCNGDNNNCGGDMICNVDGSCVLSAAECTVNADCEDPTLRCQDNECVPIGAVECNNNNDCEDDELCRENECVQNPDEESFCSGTRLDLGDSFDVGPYTFELNRILPGDDCNEAKIRVYKDDDLVETITKCPRSSEYSVDASSSVRICRVDNSEDFGIFEFSVGDGLVHYCDDSDGGNFPSKKGTISWGTKNFEGGVMDRTTNTDVCNDENSVTEYYCDSLNYGKQEETTCPNNGVCKDGACAEGTQQVKVRLEKGWNSFSVPLQNFKQLSSSCGELKLWTHDPNVGKYVKPSSLAKANGYWHYSDKSCEITFQGETYGFSGVKLKKGWNQVGSSTEKQSLSDLLVTCDVVHGPWSYNPVEKTYELSDEMEPGKGYFVKVSNDCQMEG